MADKEKILAALAEFDPLDDDQWTTDGAPLVEVVAKFTGDFGIKRQDIINAAPDFNRNKAKAEPEIQEDPEPEIQEDLEPEIQEDPKPAVEMTEAEYNSWLIELPIEDLEEAEDSLNKQNDVVGAEIQKLKELQERISRMVTVTRNLISLSFPNSSNAHAIRSFIESQAKAREQRVTRRMTVLQNIRLDELDPRAPIDAAMSRKSGRGVGRPVRPMMK